MRYAVCLLLVHLVLGAASVGADAGQGELRVADLGRCPLQGGGAIEDCRVAYRLFGTLNGARDNALLFPSWYDGTTQDLVDSGYIGPGRLADTERYFVIAVEAFGSGESSSPSNSPGQAGAEFPEFSIHDMVAAQRRLVSEALGLERLAVVLGISMGGMQALHWWARHPGLVGRVVAVEGTPWPTAFDRLVWDARLEATLAYDGTEASLRRADALLRRLSAMALWTPGEFNRFTTPDTVKRVLEGLAPPPSVAALLDLRAQTRALLSHDIRPGDGGDFTDRSRATPLMLVVFSQDHLVNPAPSIELAREVGAELLVHDSPCGHLGATEACAGAEVTKAVHRFLDRK
jgi:homoserine O-acetyltransferase